MLSPTATAAPTTTQQDPLVLRYSAPAPLNRWQEESLPIGNGALGASVFGQVVNDELFLNEKTLWTGGPGVTGYRYGNYPADQITQRRANLQEVRDRINTVGQADPGWVAGKLGQPKVGYGNYQSFGKLQFAFDNGVGTPSDYERSLDIDNSVAKVTYKVGDTTFTREYIASYPDNVIMMKISADQPGAVNFTTTYDRKLQDGVADNQEALSSGTVTASGSRITLSGVSPNNGLTYNAQADIATDGGTTTAAGASITVAGADSATLVWAAATDYGPQYNADITRSYRDGRTAEQVAAEVTQRVGDARAKGWSGVMTAHQADYKNIYDRVKLDLDGAALTLPTNQARSAYRGTSDQDRTLETLYYQYGRYLLISSSRDVTLGAANLQGVWNERNNPPWSADYHTNINVQMNYWPALSGNMPESYDAYLDYITSLVDAGATSAENVLGIQDSWMVMNETTPYGFTGVFDWSTAFWFPEANAWLAQAFWWKYLYTGDEDFLRTTAYPMLKKTSKFWEQYLVEDPRDGTLVANPSYSPEHGPFVAGAAMSQQIATELFQSTIEAAEILGVDSEVAALRSTLADTDPGLTISDQTGMILEWKGTEELGEIGHRHVSHLYALWPGRNISANTTPELAEAARKSLVHRGDGGTGWSMAWKINFWAKLFDGDHAHQMVKNIISNSTYANLWDAHPPFQIDGNFGATSGINEMLVANDPGLITVLPALPAAWSNGSVDGIKAWNDVTVGTTWASGAAEQIRLSTGNAGQVKVKTTLAGAPVTVRDGSGATVAATRADGVISFTATGGGTYTIDGDTKLVVTDAPESLVYSTDGVVSVDYVGAPAGAQLVVEAPEGWQLSPERQVVAEGDGTASFTVRTPNTGTQGTLRIRLVATDLEVSATVGIQLTDPAIIPVQTVAAWDSAEAGGEGAVNGYVSAAIDGNPSTFWHTQWSAGTPNYPHYIVLDLGEEKEFTSFTYTPRPKSDCGSSNDPAVCNGQIGGYEIQVPTAGTWVPPTAAQLRQAQYAQPADAAFETIASGTFEKNTAPKVVTLEAPVTARYVKLLATSPAATGQAWAHAGELGVRGTPAANPEPLPNPSVVVSPVSVEPGETVTITGAGWTSGEAVTITVGDAMVTATANAEGAFTASHVVPTGTASGALEVVAVGAFKAVASTTLTVADATGPVVTPIAAQSATVGEAFQLQVTASDPSVPLTYTVANAPSWLTIDTAGKLTGTPTGAGSYNVTVRVADAEGNVSSVTFALTVEPAVEPSPSASPSPSKSPKPSKSPTAKPTTTPTKPGGGFVRTAPYTLAGTHLLNDRQWMTTCEDYSQTERCRTEIWATVVQIENGEFVRKSGWVFNNLTYLPFMTREAWKGNPLGDMGSTTNGLFASAGRQWKTECDTAATGRGACRSYTWTTVYAATAKPMGGYTFSQSNDWVFNNIVMFKTR
ncbi:glycoside hydrolase N-terminal domain-containing protein [Tessaracoccus sp. MC1756]|uniref:glycosyl hydrolase family 95 catalytic domain-containing protein n=1 Tax=Tessaracoccus sp. MC1756 TaxID=2760311 RepID=UPI00160278FB|nr:glycoside hydrolase N-terminal domain-containing protein [Tessaracoccus sp. MC1756]MBB1509692.1 glycoside hydrolase N-terminal domain-containing protein [Tessaracoccus sp. MC1756]